MMKLGITGHNIDSTNHRSLPLPMIGRNVEKQKYIKRESDEVSHFVLIGSNRISRLDLESHRNFSFLAKVYLIFVILAPMIPFVFVFGCLEWFDDAEESKCSTFVQLFYYFSNILSYLNSSIVNPVGFVALSSDLTSCLKARSHRKSPAAKELKNHEMCELSNIYRYLANSAI